MREIKFRAWDISWKRFDGDIALPIGRMSKNIDEERFILLQFTGLKDKNGKEIYEDDILSFFKTKYIVKWDLFSFKFIDERGRRCYFDDLSNTEVIGNIYENPELLDPKQEEALQ